MKLSTIQKRENLNIVKRLGESGPGGAYHDYAVFKNDGDEMPDTTKESLLVLRFQCGPRKDKNSTHGVLDNDLLEIVRDRLKSFQAGPYASDYNAKALEHIELALMYQNRIVEDRIERNVLGTYNK